MFQVIRKPKKQRIILPDEYYLKKPKGRIATFDTETDPFKDGRIVKPFTCGFYLPDTGEYHDFWGADCIDQFFVFLDANFSEEPLTIYTHNGGNFDFYFMVDHFDPGMSPFIINGRLVRIICHGQEFRDSYSAIPVALDKYHKTEIDYALFEKEEREQNKEQIRAYQKDDCIYLSELIVTWLSDFGDKLTMASVALPKLREHHGVEVVTPETDEEIRPYYFGGRVECFETGLLQDNWKVYDVNSMYPFVMAEYKHPVSSEPIPQLTITDNTQFAYIRARSEGALPVRQDDGSLAFPHETRDFYACIHEINAGLETKTLEILSVHTAFRFEVCISFKEFIDTFYARRMNARRMYEETKEDKWKIDDLFTKLVMNSSYGKLAQDPRKYENYIFDPSEPPLPSMCGMCKDNTCESCKNGRTANNGWYIHTIRGERIMYARPQIQHGSSGFYNVSTAASITSAARAELLRGITSASRPIYCDTDNIICRDLHSSRIDPNQLGAWKVEATGNLAAIAGKKLYAVFNDMEEVKKASKGVKLTAEEIKMVAEGHVIEYANPVPKFSLDGNASFVTRTIQRTT